MAENGLEHALKAIDPVARAMLDLSIRRRLPDSSIADLAQMPPDELVRWRGEVLDQLATEIGLTGPGSREGVRAQLESIEPAAWVGVAAAKSPPRTTPAPEPKPKVQRQRPSRRLLGLLGLLVILVIIIAIISLSGDDESGDAAPPPTSTTSSTSTSTTHRADVDHEPPRRRPARDDGSAAGHARPRHRDGHRRREGDHR